MTQPPLLLAQLGTWFFAALVLASAVLVVTLGNLFRAALSLGVVLLGVAGLFLLAGAEFLAFVQILVYVGAILTLVIFAIMLTARMQGSQAGKALPPAGRPATEASAGRRWPAAAASAGLFIVLASAVNLVPAQPLATSQTVSLTQLGRELVTTLVLPFEIISVLFVASIVGAVAIASSKVPK